MTSIYRLRTYCPVCNVVIKPVNIRRHFLTKHSEVSEKKISEYEEFIRKCIMSNASERISIDLVSFSVTLLDRSYGVSSLCNRGDIVSSALTMNLNKKKVIIKKEQNIFTENLIKKRRFSLSDKLNCKFCSGVGGLESSHGCFYCGG